MQRVHVICWISSSTARALTAALFSCQRSRRRQESSPTQTKREGTLSLTWVQPWSGHAFQSVRVRSCTSVCNRNNAVKLEPRKCSWWLPSRVLFEPSEPAPRKGRALAWAWNGSRAMIPISGHVWEALRGISVILMPGSCLPQAFWLFSLEVARLNYPSASGGRAELMLCFLYADNRKASLYPVVLQRLSHRQPYTFHWEHDTQTLTLLHPRTTKADSLSWKSMFCISQRPQGQDPDKQHDPESSSIQSS